MRYLAPPGEVVFDNDPTAAARLIRTGRYVEVCANYKDLPGLNGAARVINLGGSLEDVPGIAFIHGRRVNGRSNPRVVVVAGLAVIERTPHGCGVGIGAACYRPAPIAFEPPGLESASSGWLEVPPGQRLRVFAGQPDPIDESHFTIAYELDGVPGVIEGWLRDESFNGVELKVTSGPAVLNMVQ